MQPSSAPEVLRAWRCVVVQLDAVTACHSDKGTGLGLSTQGFLSDVGVLRKHGVGRVVEAWFLDAIRQRLLKGCLASFVEGLAVYKTLPVGPDSWTWVCETLPELCKELGEAVGDMAAHASVLQEALETRGLPSKVFAMAHTCLIAASPVEFTEIVSIFLTSRFHALHTLYCAKKEDEMEGEEDEWRVELWEIPAKLYEEDVFRMVCRHLDVLGCGPLLEEAASEIAYRKTEFLITQSCKGSFHVHMLEHVRNWVHNVGDRFLEEVLSAQGGDGSRVVPSWRTRLDFFMHEMFGGLRISELFDIIIDYPDSMPALEDLRVCLTQICEHGSMITALSSAFAKRLLHPGANTSDIIETYISTIKCLRLLDPTGVVLERISDPVKEYLRERKDTIRCIVTSLIDDEESELFAELRRHDTNAREEEDTEDEEEGGAVAWIPDPVEADPSKPSKSRTSQDILSRLVGIYGSRDLFVVEYRTLLADKLLSLPDYDIDSEIRNLELLKLRFGETNLAQCEVMLRDISESKRTDANLQSRMAKYMGEDQLSLHASILSHVFWPTLNEESIVLAPEIEQQFKAYEKEYHIVKAPRRLHWKRNLGMVEVKVTLASRTLQLSVSPVHASILLFFQEKDTWTTTELASMLNATPDYVKRKMVLLLNQGIVREVTRDVFEVMEHMEEGQGTQAPLHQYIEEDNGAGAASAQGEQDTEKLESYITSILTNLGGLPLERIHNMLKLFVSEPPYEQTQEELSSLLSSMCDEGRLEFRDDVFQIK